MAQETPAEKTSEEPFWKGWKVPGVLPVVGGVLLAATAVVVPLEAAPTVADQLNLHGPWRMAAYTFAMVADVVWIGALSKAPTAARQGAWWTFAFVTLVALAGAGASVAAVLAYGGAPFLAFVPVAALLIHVLGLLTEETLDSGEAAQAVLDTRHQVRAARLYDRNRTVRAPPDGATASITRAIEAQERLDVVAAEEDYRDAVVTLLADRYAIRTEAASRMQKRLDTVDREHGALAEAFGKRNLSGPDSDRVAITAQDRVAIEAGAEDVTDEAADVVDAELARALAESDWLDVARAPGADTPAASARTVAADVPKRSTVSARVDERTASNTASDQVAASARVDERTVAEPVAASARVDERTVAEQRKAERAERIAAVRSEGLDAKAVVARWGVHITTARGYVRDAAQLADEQD